MKEINVYNAGYRLDAQKPLSSAEAQKPIVPNVVTQNGRRGVSPQSASGRPPRMSGENQPRASTLIASLGKK